MERWTVLLALLPLLLQVFQQIEYVDGFNTLRIQSFRQAIRNKKPLEVTSITNDGDGDKIQYGEKGQSHIPQTVIDSLKSTGHKYYCKTCAVGFRKKKNYEEHMAGRKHQRVDSEQAEAWSNFVSNAPSWSTETNRTDASPLDVHTCWRYTELADFPHRSSCIDPSLTIDTLPPHLRARFWRYLTDSFGQHYPELPAIFHHISLSTPRYLRVKELFEALEAFQIIGRVIATAEHGGDQGTIDTLYDLACGHGLLGALLAYRFPNKKVICVDLEARDSFSAFRLAFETMGERYENRRPLLNLEYREADLSTVRPEVGPRSFLMAVHACNDANKEVVSMAKVVGAGWAVMPCCIRTNLYLNGAAIMDLSSEVRYTLLSGAFAEASDAQMVRSISREITARPIIIIGGIYEDDGAL